MDSRQWVAMREMIPFIVLATLAVLCRFLARRVKNASIGADDYMIVVGLILTYATFADSVVQVKLGVGKHTRLVPEGNFTRLWKTIFAITFLYASAIMAIKLSILLFYRRLFSTKRFKLATVIVGVIVLLWWLAVILVQVLQCRPIQGIWDPTLPRKCINETLYYIGVAVPNVATDIIMLCLPVRMVWRLHASLVHKVALTLTFLTGGLVIFASLYRIAMLHKEKPDDPFWWYHDPNIWTTVEPAIGVVCACLPTLRPLFRFVERQRGSQHGIQLSSSETDVQGSKQSGLRTWIDDDLNLQPVNQGTHTTAVSSARKESDAERDERLLPAVPGIVVSRNVDVERASH